MTDRRKFLGAIAALSAGAALPIDESPRRRLLDQLKASIASCSMPLIRMADGLRHARTYLDAWREAYGVGNGTSASLSRFTPGPTPWDCRTRCGRNIDSARR